MTQDEIIEMARESGMELYGLGKDRARFVYHLVAFTNLVAAKEREALAQEQEPVAYSGNGTAGREADVRPTGFFFQMPEQEPVAWMYQEYRDDDQFGWRDEILFTPPPNDPIYFRNITPVYTHPPQRTEQEPVKIVQYNCTCGRTMKFESVHGVVAPQRTWQGLTLDEIALLHANYPNPQGFALALQAKLKEKNT